MIRGYTSHLRYRLIAIKTVMRRERTFSDVVGALASGSLSDLWWARPTLRLNTQATFLGRRFSPPSPSGRGDDGTVAVLRGRVEANLGVCKMGTLCAIL